ncbi:MAG TPA: SCO family protein [Xanthomonadaceae bacterium]|nr:SCO family protein [Xanthomonadaceae bacterium]
MFNRSIVVVLVIALAAGLGLLAGRHLFSRAAEAPVPALEAVRLLPAPRALPAFDLAQADGTRLEPADLQGHWTIVFLGFTHCPDVCPTTLAELAMAQDQWEGVPGASRPRVLFVSVDPERDTAEATGRYAHHFHPDTLAATGDIPSLEAFATSLGMVFMKAPPPEGAPADQYSVDHSATLVLVDPQGRMAGLLRPPLQPDAIAADLLALTAVIPVKAGLQ